MASLGEQSSPGADRAVVAIEALIAVVVVSAVIGTSYGPAATVGFLLVGTALAATVMFLWRMIAALRDPALDRPATTVDTRRLALETEKSILLHGIKELEGDEGTGKVDSADYQALRRAAEARAMAIIKELSDSDRHWLEEAEALVARRAGKAAPDRQRSAASGAATSAPDAAAAPAEPAPAAPAPVIARVEPAHPGVFPAGTTRMTPVEGGALRCSACATDNPTDARYCTGCGRPREAA